MEVDHLEYNYNPLSSIRNERQRLCSYGELILGLRQNPIQLGQRRQVGNGRHLFIKSPGD